ncbi:MAG: hypothetical protein EXR99_16775 [Gemmataceae bacterium]|nr:hypothetical protein [Gemmataceae bacterium]
MASVGIVQGLRIAASVRRAGPPDGEAEGKAYVPTFVLQFGWHIPFSGLLMIPLLVAWTVALLRRF